MNMKAKPKLEQSMQEEQIRTALNTHWHAPAVGDANAEHDLYDDDAICDYPQSGERILGRSKFAGLAESSSRQAVRLQGQADSRKRGSLDLGIHNHLPGAPGVHLSIMQFRNAKVVYETQYFVDPIEAPAWRRQWVQQMA
jgi:hypothetical protein